MLLCRLLRSSWQERSIGRAATARSLAAPRSTVNALRFDHNLHTLVVCCTFAELHLSQLYKQQPECFKAALCCCHQIYLLCCCQSARPVADLNHVCCCLHMNKAVCSTTVDADCCGGAAGWHSLWHVLQVQQLPERQVRQRPPSRPWQLSNGAGCAFQQPLQAAAGARQPPAEAASGLPQHAGPAAVPCRPAICHGQHKEAGWSCTCHSRATACALSGGATAPAGTCSTGTCRRIRHG